MEKLVGGVLYLKTWTRMNAFKDGRRIYIFERVSGGKSSWRQKASTSNDPNKMFFGCDRLRRLR